MTALPEPPEDPYEDNQQGNTPPQDTAAEMAVLGSMLLSAEARVDAVGILRPGDFWRPANETVFATIAAMHDAGEPVDPITVAARIKPGELKKVGGAVYLHTLAANTPIAANATHYAEIVRDKSRRRRLIAAGTQLITTGRNAEDLDTAFDQAYKTIDETVADFGPRTTTSTWAALPLDAVLQGGELDPPPSQLQRTDGKHLLYAGATHTFSGEPGSGKTWLALEAAKQELDQGNTVTMIDFEDRASRVVGRLLALGVHPTRISTQFRYVRPNTPLNATDRPDLTHATAGASLVILDGVTEAMTMHGLDLNNNADVATFYGLLPRAIADQGPAVVMIDHVAKDETTRGRWALGGQHKLAGTDGVGYLIKAIEPFGRGKVGHSRVIVARDRPGYIEEIAAGRSVAELWLDARHKLALKCDLKPSIGIPREGTGEFRYTIVMEQVSRFIETNDGCTSTEIYAGVESHKKNITQALAALLTEEFIVREPGARRAQYHHSLRPYRRGEDEADS